MARFSEVAILGGAEIELIYDDTLKVLAEIKVKNNGEKVLRLYFGTIYQKEKAKGDDEKYIISAGTEPAYREESIEKNGKIFKAVRTIDWFATYGV